MIKNNIKQRSIIDYFIVLFLIFECGQLCQATQQMTVDSTSKNQVFSIQNGEQEQTLILNLQNNYVAEQLQKDIFLCFIVTFNPTEIDDNSLLDPSYETYMDLESCFLSMKQTISIDLPRNTNQVYITPVFIDENKSVNFIRSIPIDTSASGLLYPLNQKCDNLCNGGTCNKFEIDNKSICLTCPQNRVGLKCSYLTQTVQGNKNSQSTLKTKEWNFFEVNVDVQDINDNYHLVISNRDDKSEQLFNFYWNFQVKLYNGEREDTILPGFRFSKKIENFAEIDEIIQKNLVIEYIQQKFPDKQLNQSRYKLIFIISLYNLANIDMNVDFLVADETTYNNMKDENFGIFNLPTWVFYLMICLSILFFVLIICLVRALVKRGQDDDQRVIGVRRPLQQLSSEIVDTYIPKYTFKHIFKAIKKRRLEILEEYSSIVQNDENEQNKQKILEQDEIRKRVQERCENILSNGECGICLCDFELEEECRLTICEHIFHVGCFDPWLYKNQNCPYCRTTINEETMKEWKSKNQQYYPLDESLGSVQTLDSKDSEESPKKGNQNQEQKADADVIADNNPLTLEKKKSSQKEKSSPVSKKPIYFHSLSLQSLQDKSISPTAISNNKRKSQKFQKLFLNQLTIQEENYHKKRKTATNLDTIFMQQNQQNANRKQYRASTFVFSTIKQIQKIEPGSANFKNDFSEQNIEDYNIKQFDKLDVKGDDFLKTNYQDCVETQASARTRQDSQTLSILQEVLSNQKLFQGQDSSAKLIKNGKNELKNDLQDSISEDTNDSIKGYKYNEKPKRISKFAQKRTISKQTQDSNNNQEINIENLMKTDLNQEQQTQFTSTIKAKCVTPVQISIKGSDSKNIKGNGPQEAGDTKIAGYRKSAPFVWSDFNIKNNNQ